MHVPANTAGSLSKYPSQQAASMMGHVSPWDPKQLKSLAVNYSRQALGHVKGWQAIILSFLHSWPTDTMCSKE